MEILSAVVLTKNEEKNLPSCLKALKFCDEIIVIDDNSTDNSVKIAKKYKAKVFKRLLNNNFASQRNFALTKTKGDWILFVDADEVVDGKLAKEIRLKISQKDIGAFYIKRKDYWKEKYIQGGESGNIKLLRLIKKGSGKWKRRVHEIFITNKKTQTLNNFLIHKPHQSIFEFVSEINYYSSLHGIENQKENKDTSFFKIMVYPFLKFFHIFILKQGYLDGVHGFVLAMMMSFHSFLSWSKLWQ